MRDNSQKHGQGNRYFLKLYLHNFRKKGVCINVRTVIEITIG